MELYTQKQKYCVPLGKRKSVNNALFLLCLQVRIQFFSVFSTAT